MRTSTYRRNPKLEELLHDLNALLINPNREIEDKFESPSYPIVFIVGCPRSGTTVLLQWLASSGAFGYPSNLISRFYAAPYIGARIQQMLTDPRYSYGHELFDIKTTWEFSSNLGKTEGALAPNEFWYFWRRFIPNEIPRYLMLEEETQVDARGLVAGLAALEHALEKPLAMKALILQYNLPLLASALNNRVLFLFIRRHYIYNMQSLLASRVKFYGSRDIWYSSKPKEYEWLKERDPVEQVAGQVYYTNRAIDEGLAQLPAACRLDVEYEAFCQKPKALFDAIKTSMQRLGFTIDKTYEGPAAFKNTNELTLNDNEVDRVKDAWSRVSGIEQPAQDVL